MNGSRPLLYSLQLDLIAFGGYKFVGLVLNMLAGIFFGRAVYFAVSSWP